MGDWHRVATIAELDSAGKPLVFKRGRKQLAIVRAGERCYAIDNRCPHEGYPLSQGSVAEGDGDGEDDAPACVLTCNWHNWKFSLDSGRNLLGGDDVRTYAVERRAGDDGVELWVDLSDPPAEVVRATVQQGLRAAFDDRDHGWIARELARLCAAGIDPIEGGVAAAIGWCAPRLQWGVTHAFAATADWLTLYDRESTTESRLICLTEAIDHMAFDALREPEYPFPGPSGRYEPDAFVAAVEREDADAAIAMARAGLRDGLIYAVMEGGFARAALSHYTGFGHGLIYVGKVGELITRTSRATSNGLGAAVADSLVASLTRYLCYATREDLIPEFRAYGPAVESYPAHGDDPGPIPEDQADALIGKGLRSVLRQVAALAERYTPTAVFDVLLWACAHNMVRFGTARGFAAEVKVADNVNWLDFTHALTFGSAARQICGRHPALWGPALLQLGCFCARNRAYVDASIDPADWYVEPEGEEAFFAAAREQILDHGIGLPIFSAHLLKTTLAVELERELVSPRTRRTMLGALRRYLCSPIKQKHARRNVHQAMALVGLDVG